MAQNKQALKSRIRSIRSTRKITSAMEMIANAKLTKQRNIMENNREYAASLHRMVEDIIALDPNMESKFLLARQSEKTLYIVFGSDLGLCGAYNINVLKLAKEHSKKDDLFIVIGTKLYNSFKSEGFNIVNEPVSSDGLTFELTAKLTDMAIKKYLSDETGKIKVIHTRFINTVTFKEMISSLLPYDKKSEGSYQEIIFDPDIHSVLDNLIVMMSQSLTYALALESRVAEQAARRMAMENANDNAEELEDKLVLAYNQARQAAITQEITEIVSGADAL